MNKANGLTFHHMILLQNVSICDINNTSNNGCKNSKIAENQGYVSFQL